MAEFDWPCERREAHGPHPIKDTTVLSDDQLAVFLSESPSSVTEFMCPGVKAHPNTMIGRGHG